MDSKEKVIKMERIENFKIVWGRWKKEENHNIFKLEVNRLKNRIGLI